jgi:hypothetical protein
VSEWGRGGGQVPRNEAAQREHLKEVQEDLQRDREAERVAKARHKRPWWQFCEVATNRRLTTSQARTPGMAERRTSSLHINHPLAQARLAPACDRGGVLILLGR